ncbi:family 43 glycosylhydrolase [Nocardioides sp. SYSU DS0663]|uniref:family 43 glycosylhydrolase n=1 Tax=Nocardioides sp. SYSU DS0663 TaxID=3416445 RepID=UPI003F4BD0AD
MVQARSRGRRRTRALVGALVASVAATLAVVAAGPGPAAGEPRPKPQSQSQAQSHRQPQPVAVARGFADPAVVRHAQGYVAISTGRHAPRATAPSPTGPWVPTEPALARLPRWVASPAVWAADLVQVGPRWLLYYSAPVRGLGRDARCIGVASAPGVLSGFRPIGDRPLVCPRRARAPRAQDVVPRTPRLRHERGVIDPSAFHDRDGRQYLLYKTQSAPSTIRLVRLTADGTGVVRGARSRELLRQRGVTENPELVRRGRHLVLYTSEGYFGDCGYRTTWRRSTSLWRWDRSRRRALLSRSRHGVCGPGGLDLVEREGAPNIAYFHGWTCWRTERACPAGRDLERRPDMRPQRSLFAGEVHWRKGRPTIRLLRRD